MLCVCVCVCVCVFFMCCVQLVIQFFATPWTITCQAPHSMGFFRQEYWGWLPFPLPGGLSDSVIKLLSPVSLQLASRFFFFTTLLITVLPGKPDKLTLAHTHTHTHTHTPNHFAVHLKLTQYCNSNILSFFRKRES